MRRPPPKTLDLEPSLLRHFAMITIAITGCIAMFANGENAQLIEEKIAAQNVKIQAEAAARAKRKSRVVNGMVIAPGTNIDGSDNAGGDNGSNDSGGSSSGLANAGTSGSEQYQSADTQLQPREAKVDSPLALGQERAGPIGYVPTIPSPLGIIPGQAPQGKPGKNAPPPRLSAHDISRIMAESRARSNGAASR